jgi:hypothetical protein
VVTGLDLMGLGGFVHAIAAGDLRLRGSEFVVFGEILLLNVIQAGDLLEVGKRVEITQWIFRA